MLDFPLAYIYQDSILEIRTPLAQTSHSTTYVGSLASKVSADIQVGTFLVSYKVSKRTGSYSLVWRRSERDVSDTLILLSPLPNPFGKHTPKEYADRRYALSDIPQGT
jgi:hypothetical protein